MSVEKKILAIGAGIGAAAGAVSASAILFAQQYGWEWLFPVAIVASLANAGLGAFLAAYRSSQ